MTFILSNTVFKFLQERPDEKYTARQVAEWIVETFPDEGQAKKQSSQYVNTDADLVKQYTAEIASQRPRLQKNHPEVKTTEGRPRKYYYSEKSDFAEVADAESNDAISSSDQNDTKPLREHDLYPFLSIFLKEELKIHSKRIDEKCSSNTQGPKGNHWLYPDIVGMEDLGAEWLPEVRNCVKENFDKRTKLWSFEVKLLINRSNARECFFQTVSNSSWANFGYLVAATIKQDTLKELRMLSAAHGIGLIQLDTDNPTESQVLIPAYEKSEIDWDAANRLATESKDFLEYLKVVKQLYQTGEARLTDWDAPV
jgi:hypothetical protein